MKDKEQHIIDTTVRQALENLEVPYVADHWQLMVGKLDALDANEAEFDNNFADTLRGIEAPLVANHWQLMADKLDALDAEETEFDKDFADKLRGIEVPLVADHWQLMADKLGALDAQEAGFDNNFADKLKGIEVPYVASNWADMSARLDDLDDAETAFDDLLSQRLERLQVNYQPEHWNFMAQRIEETFSWRAKVVRYKLVEVALVLLTLFTVGNMLDLPFDSDYSNTNNTDIKVEKTIKSKENEVKEAAPEKVKETKSFYNPSDWRTRPVSPNDKKSEQDGINKPVAAFNNTPLDAVSKPFIVQLNNIEGHEPLNNVINKVINNGVNNNSDGGEPTVVVLTNETTQIAKITEGPIFDKLPMKKVLALGRVKDEKPIDNQTVLAAASKVLHPIDILKPNLLNTRFYDENVTFPLFVEKKAKWRLNIFGLPLADMVSYNYSLKRTKITEKEIAANLGAGIAFGYNKGRVEIESGLTYLDKKYGLPNVEVIRGNFRNSYTVEKPQYLHLNIVSIPLSINYMAKETMRWRFYARVGAALNTIFSSKEEQFVETTSNSSNSQAPAQSNISEYEPNVYPKGVFRKDFFKDGKWYGGFKENAYLTANAGVGVEYRLTNKLNIYVQPTMDYHIGKNGIGSLNDRINSFSVQGGVKMNIK